MKKNNLSVFPLSTFSPLSFSFFLLLSLLQCKEKLPSPTPSFYYWKQQFSWTTEDSLQAQQRGLKQLYVKFFDVKDLPSEGIVPAATIEFQQKMPNYLGLVPVVYIENSIFIKQDSNQTQALAKRVFNRISEILPDAGKKEVPEYQIDCDWSKKSKAQYFYFLHTLKGLLPEKSLLSSTIRLHQVKYSSEMGVPPADKGLLMYYNMGDLKKRTTENSILDNQEGARYLRTKKEAYPLGLDVALPIFEWSVLFEHNEFKALLSAVKKQDFSAGIFLKPLEKNRYLCVKDTLLGTTFLREGNLVRHEVVSKDALELAAQLCQKYLTSKEQTVLFFHWDKALLEQHNVEEMQAVMQMF